VLPDEKFGFRPGRSTLTKLLGEKEDALKQPLGKLFAIYIVYSKSFDLLDRAMIIRKLKRIPVCSQTEKHIVKNILSEPC
jgi:hypothetical protein